MDSKKSGVKPLIILLLLFILPIIAAKVVLSFSLYQGAATNTGELLAPSNNYKNLDMENPKPSQWQLIYLLPEHCDSICFDRLYILKQSHIALGKDRSRVHTLILQNKHSDRSAIPAAEFDMPLASKAIVSLLEKQELIIVDPLGSLVMRYPSVPDREQQILQGKALVSDLRKMLKLTRVY